MAKFTQICSFEKQDDRIIITGPMSPILGLKEYGEQLGFEKPLRRGVVRVKNEQSYDHTYDHLAIMPYDNTIAFFVDMGHQGIPVCIYFINDKTITVTPIYKKNITEEAMENHRDNMECPSRCQDNPIMRLTEKQLKDLMEELIESKTFLTKEDYVKAKSVLLGTIS